MKTGNLSLDQAPPEDIPFRFLMTGPAFGILAGLILAVFGGRIFITAWSLDTVALTHTITLGWLTLIMMGAFYQMIPVLVGGHVPWIKLPRYIYHVLVAGILSLVFGLLTWFTPLLMMAAVLLSAGLTGFIVQALVALFKVKANKPVVYAMRISVICLFVTFTIGVFMLGLLYDWWYLPIDRGSLKYMHLTTGLLGWVCLLIFGVSFHVIPMFYLTKAFNEKISLLIISLVTFSIFALSCGFLLKLEKLWLLGAGVPAIIGISIFVWMTSRLIWQRQRKMVDTTLRFWKLGLVFLIPAVLMVAVDLFRYDETFTYLFGIFFLLGFAVAISNGMLYKIIPFLVWLHRFSSLVGKIKTPSMKDIIGDRPARIQFYFFNLTLLTLIPSVIFRVDPAIRGSGMLWAITSFLLFFQLIKGVRVRPSEVPEIVSADDFAAMFKDLKPPTKN
ncbi:MAG: hypothetical protein HQ517_07710 [SAR324 cluster bacterium]|nr:hypothetical protein [SAR324 cluster bacterium]